MDLFGNTRYHSAKIVASLGCTCPKGRPWWNCGCPVVEWEYRALGDTWFEIDEGFAPSPIPAIDAVAQVLREHPGATVRYIGGSDRITGPGEQGTRTHFEIALERSRNVIFR